MPKQPVVVQALWVEYFVFSLSLDFVKVQKLDINSPLSILDVLLDHLIVGLGGINRSQLAIQVGILFIDRVGQKHLLLSVSLLPRELFLLFLGIVSVLNVDQRVDQVHPFFEHLSGLDYKVTHMLPSKIVGDEGVELRGEVLQIFHVRGRIPFSIIFLNYFFDQCQVLVSLGHCILGQFSQRKFLRIVSLRLHLLFNCIFVKDKVYQALDLSW